MDQTPLSESSRYLTPHQKEVTKRVLEKLASLLVEELANDFGPKTQKVRTVSLSGKKLDKWLRVLNIDRDFFHNILEVLKEEQILLRQGVSGADYYIVKDNEQEEERYGKPMTIIYPPDFQDRSEIYSNSLQQNPDTTLPDRHYRNPHKENLFITILEFVSIPFLILWYVIKSVLGFFLKTIWEIVTRAWSLLIIAVALVLAIAFIKHIPFIPPDLVDQILHFLHLQNDISA